MSYLPGIALLLLVMSPPLVPATIGAIRAIVNWRPTYERLRVALTHRRAVTSAA